MSPPQWISNAHIYSLKGAAKLKLCHSAPLEMPFLVISLSSKLWTIVHVFPIVWYNHPLHKEEESGDSRIVQLVLVEVGAI